MKFPLVFLMLFTTTLLVAQSNPRAQYEKELTDLVDAIKEETQATFKKGPIFYFDQPVEFIGTGDKNDVTIPIPNAFFKSVLAEKKNGNLNIWSFILPNEKSSKKLNDFLVPTLKIEKYSGMVMWENLLGNQIQEEKKIIKKMWAH